MEALPTFKAKLEELVKAPWPRKLWLSLSLLGLWLYFLLALLAIQFLRLISISCFFCR